MADTIFRKSPPTVALIGPVAGAMRAEDIATLVATKHG
jgi:hypothetical protein